TLIARALMPRPRLLLLDEPTEGIQPSVVAEIQDRIVELATGAGIRVLLVEQHLGFALRVATRHYVLESGRVTATGDGGRDAERSVRQALAV
ncbi:ABC transporter ATP-binding protein, partial [Micromonospora humida]